jgi:glycogen synthase
VHVLVTTDTLGEVWAYTRELVTGLHGHGIRVTLVSFGDIPLPEHTQWMDDVDGLDYRPTAFRLDWMQEGEQDHGEATNYLTGLVRELKPSVLHLNHLSHGSLPVKTPRIAVAHGDMISWWNAVHGCDPKDGSWLRWYRDVVTRGLRQASAVVAPSYAMLDALQESYAWGRAGTVIYEGRNPVLFNSHLKKENSVLAVGAMLDAGKQVVLLTQRTHALPVCIVGAEGTALGPRMPIRTDVKVAVEPLCLAVKGPQTESQMRALYGRASIFAATARYESAGTTMIEAALSRCAIVANDTPLHREMWDDAAAYFRTNDPGSLAETIRRMSEDREVVQGYGNRAYQRARERFTARRMVNEYVELYRELIGTTAVAA